MTSVDENRLRGNYAQAVVSAWLSRACLVRPVADGTDIGVDLYCESVLEGQPFLHFWVQVKAIPTASVAPDGEKHSASYSFERRHLAYWDRQPVPVYAFLVPLDWPPSSPKTIYGVRITKRLVRDGLPSTASVTYRTSEGFEAVSLDADLHQFITQIVPWDSSAMLLKRGIVAPIPPTVPNNEDSFPVGIGFQHLHTVLKTIRDASVHGLYHSLMVEHYHPDWHPVRKRFEALATLFESEMHKYGLSMLVRAAHADHDIERAKSCIHRALERVANDQSLPESTRTAQCEEIRILLRDFE